MVSIDKHTKLGVVGGLIFTVLGGQIGNRVERAFRDNSPEPSLNSPGIVFVDPKAGKEITSLSGQTEKILTVIACLELACKERIFVGGKNKPQERAVLALRKALALNGINLDTESSAVDPELLSAIRRFKELYGLKPDSIAGPQTYRMLVSSLKRFLPLEYQEQYPTRLPDYRS